MEIRDTRNGDWHWVYNALLADPHLTAGEKIVYSAISTFGGHQVIHPTKEQLAVRCGMDEKTVQRAIKRLEEVGYLSMDKSTGRGNANVYYLLKKPKGCNLCPFAKGGHSDDKGGHLEPERGTETTPHKDSIDKKDISERTLADEYEVEKKPKAPPKYPHSKEVFRWFPKPEKSWQINTTECKHAELLFERGEEAVKKYLRYAKTHSEDDFFFVVTKPSDLERKWEDIKAYAKRNS